LEKVVKAIFIGKKEKIWYLQDIGTYAILKNVTKLVNNEICFLLAQRENVNWYYIKKTLEKKGVIENYFILKGMMKFLHREIVTPEMIKWNNKTLKIKPNLKSISIAES